MPWLALTLLVSEGDLQSHSRPPWAMTSQEAGPPGAPEGERKGSEGKGRERGRDPIAWLPIRVGPRI